MLISVAAIMCPVFTVGFYLPARGQVALRAAYDDCQRCINFPLVADCYPGPCLHIPQKMHCMQEYANRREQIRWRYFFFQTLATHL